MQSKYKFPARIAPLYLREPIPFTDVYMNIQLHPPTITVTQCKLSGDLNNLLFACDFEDEDQRSLRAVAVTSCGAPQTSSRSGQLWSMADSGVTTCSTQLLSYGRQQWNEHRSRRHGVTLRQAAMQWTLWQKIRQRISITVKQNQAELWNGLQQ